jgi:eukaryotic-like serine/threonine-protein kinase
VNAQEKWTRLKALFTSSLELPEDEREAWLDRNSSDAPELRAEVLRLLAQQRRPAPVFTADAANLLGKLIPEDDEVDALLGRNVGAYRLTRLLGEGGMGRVYLAERDDGQFSQQVALKLIRAEFATAELHQRFLRERDTLARLAHPNIAQLHDGGVTDAGAPYFTLEFIEGDPVTRWCDARRLDIRGRLQLMLKICDAVQYAHRNLIVHRDLKPSNILVTAAGEPKLLDFGIAKPLASAAASDDLTNTQATPMTREYAAPEQVLGDPVTTATDVYSLGVLLYLLLCGQMPYRRAALGQISWIKAILEEMPEPLERALDRDAGKGDATNLAASRSTSPMVLKRSLRGDLERIVQRTLAKSPEARYTTVSAMADDVRAHLAGRAISGGTRTYRLRKFVRRHWLPLAAGALMFIVVLASAIGLAWEAGQVARQARTTAAVKDFLIDLFQKANPEIANGKMATMRDAVDLGVKRLDSIPAEQSELRAELEVTLGMIYNQLGLQQQAHDMHHEAVAVLKQHSSDPLLTVRAERFEAVETGGLGDFATAQILIDDAIARLHRLSNPPVADLVRTLDTVNYVAVHRSDLAREKQVSEEAVAAIEGVSVDDEVRAMALAMRADYLRRSHDDASAVDYYLRLWPLKLSAQTRSAYGLGLGSSLQNLGRYEEAMRYLTQARDATQQAYGEANTRTLRVGQMLAIDEVYAGQIAQGSAHMLALLEISRRQTPPHEDVIAEIELNSAEMLITLEQYAAATEHVEAALAYCAAHPNGDTRLSIEAYASLGTIDLWSNKLAEAQNALDQALRIAAEHKLGDVESTQAALALVRALLGDLDAALSLAATARDGVHKNQGERSLDAADVHYYYGRVLVLAERPADAAAEFRAAIASHAALLPPDGMHFYSAGARFALSELLVANATTSGEGRRLLEQAVTLREATLGADNPHTLEAKQALAKLTALSP